ncbi:MAG: hypothetical protein WBA57_14155 [Elainellaceae cyanobacterium]
MSNTDLSITPIQVNGNSSATHANNTGVLEELIRSIDLGQGEFSLLLVRCNYSRLRQQLLAELNEKSDLSLAELALSATETSLYNAIAHHFRDAQPAALSVLGLDAVDTIDDLLAAANNMRESFRQQFPFPVLIWADDYLLAEIRQRMPDFKSWGATTFRFDWDTDSLLKQLRDTRDRYVEGTLEHATFTPLTKLLTPQEIREGELAIAELTRRQVSLPPDILAGLEFNRGSSLLGETPRPGPEVCAEALSHYETSLSHWQAAQHSLGIGLAQFYCSLCHAHQGDWNQVKNKRQACLAAFAKAERLDLVKKFVGSLGSVLVELEDWDELTQHLPEWKALHAEQPVELSQDWSLQAEVAKHQQDWPQMQADAEQAIAIWAQHQPAETAPLAYRLQLAEALAQQGQVDSAIAKLEKTRRTHQPKDDPDGFVQLLSQLWRLYFQEKRYRKAFEIKQERRGIQYQFHMLAFLGAGQLQPSKAADSTSENHFSFVASGRQQDIDTLVNVRVGEPRHKLTVLCGPSGVGKSSLVRAGLVPALTDKQLHDRRALTVVVRVYSRWEVGLGDALYAALAAYPEARLDLVPTTINQLKAQLRRNAEHRLLTVLIFDQFEEFFFICKRPAERQQFYEFLRDCLKGVDIQFVKVIFSLREDYLHELLEFEDYVKDLCIDFLGQEQRQRIENFTPAIARSVITELSQRTTLQLDSDLVDALVASLTNELGRIRPVELQVVGAQIEAESLTTLAEYRRLGDNPKLVLSERWVGAVVEDCGLENTDAAWQVLVALTRENGTRPLLTQGELEATLEDYQKLLGTAEVSLEEDILPVLVGSGLVVRWPQEPEDRYQLVHDYLVEPIRRRYNADYRQQLEQLVRDKQAAEKKQQQEEEQRKRLEKRVLWGAIGTAGVFAGLAVFAGFMAVRSNRLAEESARAREVATARQLSAQAERILLQQPNLRSTAGLLAVESYRRFEKQATSVLEVDEPLRNAANRLPQVTTITHDEGVGSVSFSEDSQFLATGSRDGTAKLIKVATGEEVTTITHDERVGSVSFSEDSQFLATGSDDGTAKLIKVATGEEVTTITHDEWVSSVFSEDSQFLATGSGDGTAKLIEVATGEEIAEVAHRRALSSMTFTPDSNYLITASENGTVKLTNISTTSQRAEKICDQLQRNLTADEWQRYIGDLETYRLTCPNASIHPSVLEEVGLILQAKQESPSDADRVKQAQAILKRLQTINPNIDLYPHTEAVETNTKIAIQQWQTYNLVEAGIEDAQDGDLDMAIESFNTAQAQDPNIDLYPQTPVLESEPQVIANQLYAQQTVDDVRRRIDRFTLDASRASQFLEDLQTAQAADSEVFIPPRFWRKICWSISLGNEPEAALEACEAAVSANPSYGGYRDSRALARALTGDVAGAIEDFQAYVDWSGSPPRRKRQRQDWIDALKAGENPFTEELLEELQED